MKIIEDKQFGFFALNLGGFWYVQDYKGVNFVQVQDPYTSAALTQDHWSRSGAVIKL